MLEEIDRLRHALMGAVSHDLRTPLATIKVASSTLVGSSERLDASVVDELVQLIDVQTDRLTRLVTNLLDMTRIEAGVLAVRATPVDLLDLITDVVVALRPALDSREIAVHIPEATPSVVVDAVLIAQVVTNLLDNAAPPRSGVHDDLGVGRGGGSGWVTVAVSDHGPGVVADQRAAIFDTFVRFRQRRSLRGRSRRSRRRSSKLTAARSPSMTPPDGGGAVLLHCSRSTDDRQGVTSWRACS